MALGLKLLRIRYILLSYCEHRGAYDDRFPKGSNGIRAATIAITPYRAAQIQIGTEVEVSATVAITAERIPICICVRKSAHWQLYKEIRGTAKTQVKLRPA